MDPIGIACNCGAVTVQLSAQPVPDLAALLVEIENMPPMRKVIEHHRPLEGGGRDLVHRHMIEATL